MEGSVRGRRLSLEIQRDFAGSRLEEQILIRVFELITPVVRRTLENDRPEDPGLAERVHSLVAKGA